LNVLCANDISHNEIHRAGGLCVEVEMAIEKMRRYKWPGVDQITAEFDSSSRWVNAF